MDSESTTSTNNSKVSFNRDGLLQTYKCKVCSHFLTPPVRTCENGHLFCSACYDKMDRCPLCPGALLQTTFQAVDAMLENLLVPCIFEADGCPLTLNPKYLRSHADKCIHRLIKCNVHTESKKCENCVINLHLYKTHLFDVHKIAHMNNGQETMLEITFTDEDIYSDHVGGFPLQAVSFDGNTFIIRNSLQNQMFSTWVGIIGTDNDAKKYRLNICLEAALDESTDESPNREDLPVYSPHIQDLEDLTKVEGRPFQLSLASLRRTKIVSGEAIHDNQVFSSGRPFMYRWNVLYEFFKSENDC